MSSETTTLIFAPSTTGLLFVRRQSPALLAQCSAWRIGPRRQNVSNILHITNRRGERFILIFLGIDMSAFCVKRRVWRRRKLDEFEDFIVELHQSGYSLERIRVQLSRYGVYVHRSTIMRFIQSLPALRLAE